MTFQYIWKFSPKLVLPPVQETDGCGISLLADTAANGADTGQLLINLVTKKHAFHNNVGTKYQTTFQMHFPDKTCVYFLNLFIGVSVWMFSPRLFFPVQMTEIRVSFRRAEGISSKMSVQISVVFRELANTMWRPKYFELQLKLQL